MSGTGSLIGQTISDYRILEKLRGLAETAATVYPVHLVAICEKAVILIRN
jgi:hypothetical protein